MKLAETSALFQMLVEGVKDHALFTVDKAGMITSWNRGAERLLGYPEAEIMGRSISCFLTADARHGLTGELLITASQQGRAEDEGWRRAADGSCFYANVNISSLVHEADLYSGFAVVVQDITERRNIAVAQEEVRQERARMAEKFLSHVSHELRTPLTAAFFFTSNVLDGLFGELRPEQHEHLSLGFDNLNQIKVMVDDLLDITRTETHKLTVVPERVSPVTLSEEALRTCHRNAAIAGVRLTSMVEPDLPFLWADPVRVRQVLINLIDNGIKFAPASGTVTVSCKPCAEDNGFLCFSVSDTGRGISPENLELVFDRLAQMDHGGDASRRGLGLGLFIARELVAEHGGRIWVESQLGQGSTFFFTLPVFSLARICAPILTGSNPSQSLALITVQMDAVEGTIQTEVLPELRKVLELCIRGGQDILLPTMGQGEREDIFFILSCKSADGLDVVTKRIHRKIEDFDTNGELMPRISANLLTAQSGACEERRKNEAVAEIERAVQLQLQEKELHR
jgi:PAS domain S-box-containing protein